MVKGTNLELTQRFDRVFPCGHSNLRVKLSDLMPHKIFVVKGRGSRMWDADGNEYIDYMNAYGPNLLGHQHPEYAKALHDSLDTMSPIVGPGIYCSADDVELGEKLVEHIPCADQVKFSVTGTDAVQMAIRLARAYTKRPRFIRFSGQYHGWGENTLGGVINPNPEGRPFAIDGHDEDFYYTGGKAVGVNEQSFMLEYNDIEMLEEVLKNFGKEVALILLEPIVNNNYCQMPKPGYLERVRELCSEYGIVLCFDEIVTGFRMGLGGAQEYLGVTPDLATYGKAMAAGLPLSAVAGRAEIMALLEDGRVLGPGTFNGFPLSTRAALTTIKILERDDGAVHKTIDRLTKRLMEGLGEMIRRRGLPIRAQGATGLFFMIFGVDPDKVVYTNEDLAGVDFIRMIDFWKALTEAGVATLTDGQWFVSAAINDEDVDQSLDMADRVLAGV